jgi:coenzyme F420 hydrogenase subunit delta
MHKLHKARSCTTVVAGCGNPLLGDDGFGPAVIQHLKRQPFLPDSTCALDVGTNLRDLLLDYLLIPELRPDKLIIVDSARLPGCDIGEVLVLKPGRFSPAYQSDFGVHHFPADGLLQELESSTQIEMHLLLAHTPLRPTTFHRGLSPQLADAVDLACDILTEHLAPDHQGWTA